MDKGTKKIFVLIACKNNKYSYCYWLVNLIRISSEGKNRIETIKDNVRIKNR